MPEQQPIALVLASTPFERNAVREHLEGTLELVHPDGIRVEKGLLPGTSWQVVIGGPGAGAGQADAVAALLVDWLQPEAVFFVGVAGGVKGSVAIGDVVVSTRTYDIRGTGQTPTTEESSVRPEVVPASYVLEEAARSALWGMPNMQAHFGPIAASDALLPTSAYGVARFLRRHHIGDALAIALEGPWPTLAAVPGQRPPTLMICGISDRFGAAGTSNSRVAQEWAAQRAASALRAVLRSHRPKAEGVPGHRYAILVGVSQYTSPELNLPGVVGDVQALAEVLSRMGYERALTDVSVNPTSAELRGALRRWTRATRLGPDDVLFVYFAGHSAEHGGRQYLLCSDDGVSDFPHAAVPADEFTRLATDQLAGHSLIVLDVCTSGSAAGAATLRALQAGNTRPSEGRTWVLTSAQDHVAGEIGTLTRALREVLTEPSADKRQRFLAVPSVAESVRRRLGARHLPKRLWMVGPGASGEDPFFPNPAYVPGLPPDALDISSTARIRREQDDHFAAPARGVAHASVEGDLFVGRVEALSALTEWLSSPGGDNETLAVTGAPGSGKSALLGRLISLMDPDSTARLSLSPRVAPPPDAALIALSCRTASPSDITTQLSAALGLPATADRHDLFTALGARADPLVILLDSLDETPDAGRIATDLVGPLSLLPGVRVVVGTRRHQLGSLGPAVRVVDLDEPPYRDDEDVRAYARHLLDQAPLLPERGSLRYAGDPARAEAEAAAIARSARGSFLTAQLLARALLESGATPSVEEVYASLWDQRVHDEESPSRFTGLLLPLAYAQGRGLPRELWAPLAEALTDEPRTDEDVRALLAQPDGLVTEDRDEGVTVYRFFHQTFAEHLRSTGQDRERHRRMALALIRHVPVGPSGERDWQAASPYIRRHLVTHAAAGRVLDDLLTDAAFLRHAAPEPLLRALQDRATTGSAPSPSGARPTDPAPTGPSPTGPSPVTDDGTAQEAVSRLLSTRPVVLVVATEWFSAHGGLSSFNRHLCAALAAAGAQVFCTVLKMSGAEELDARDKHVTLLCHPGAPGAPEYGRLSRRPLIPLAPHLIIGHGRITGPVAAHLQEDYFPKARRLHIIHMAPDEIEWHKLDDTTDRAQRAEERTQIEHELAATAHRAFAVGPRLHGRFANALWDAEAPPLQQLNPGFDLRTGALPAPRTPPPGLPLTVLLAGRTDEAKLKGVDLAARALGLVHDLRTKASTDPVELLVRGAPTGEGGDQREDIVDWSRVPALNVTVRGFSPNPGPLDRDMGCASLVIMPSRSEGFGMIGAEAVIRGVPLLASGNSGLAQLLRDELRGDAEDLIVPVTMDSDRDAAVWAERIERCLADRETAYTRIAELRGRLAALVTWEAAAALILAEAPPQP
ncbi:caspase family protein [Streptomyces sp. NPDC006450]|uniref:phosphorylase family protein n=1 Tax=Streptomyces sp. NPDC006450 TaxID=3155458 RepID=UPI0033A4746E